MNKCPKNFSEGGIEIDCPYSEEFKDGGKTTTNCFCAASADQCYYWRYKKKASENPPYITIDDIVEKEVKESKEPKQNKMRLIEVEDEQS